MTGTAMASPRSTAALTQPLPRRRVSMPLRLGEITLLSLKFDAVVLNEPLQEAIAHRCHGNDLIAALAGAVPGVQIKGAWAEEGRVDLRADGQWLRYQYSTYPRYYIDLRQAYAQYLEKFSSKSQYNLRRQRRVYFEKVGIAPSMVAACTAEEVEDFFWRARKVSELTYQEKLLGSGLPSGPQFVEQMRAAAREGRVRGFLLPGSDGRDAAYMYCLVVGDDLVCKYIGYDPAVASLSPGSTLLLMAVEALCAEGVLRYFDFEEGGAQYKKQFATGAKLCCNVLIVRDTLASGLKLRVHLWQGLILRRLGALADRLGIRATLRKLIRRRSTAS